MLKKVINKLKETAFTAQDKLERINSFYYVSDYPISLCLEYMKHCNIYDRFSYKWEENNGYYFITFIEYKNSMRSLATSPKSKFIVIFNELGEQTSINVSFINTILQPVPFIATNEIDTFWERKLNAKRIK